jgi:hypothetical protein
MMRPCSITPSLSSAVLTYPARASGAAGVIRLRRGRFHEEALHMASKTNPLVLVPAAADADDLAQAGSELRDATDIIAAIRTELRAIRALLDIPEPARAPRLRAVDDA